MSCRRMDGWAEGVKKADVRFALRYKAKREEYSRSSCDFVQGVVGFEFSRPASRGSWDQSELGIRTCATSLQRPAKELPRRRRGLQCR